MHGRSFTTPISAIVCALICLSAGQAVAAPRVEANPANGLVPHKALYVVKLLSTKSGSQMLDLSGKMYFEWKPTCEGWITNHRFSLDYDYADNPSVNISSDFSTVENSSGTKLDYFSRRRRDGEVYDELRGSATVDPVTRAGEAVFTTPPDLSFALDKGTLFPTAHTVALVENARKGNKFLNVRIFDGSDEEGPVDINAFIGPQTKNNDVVISNIQSRKSLIFKPASTNSIDNSLLDVPGWNVRMAFFPVNAPEATADYELSMVLHENGVISDMVIEYADFSVRQKLVALEKLSPENCKN